MYSVPWKDKLKQQEGRLDSVQVYLCTVARPMYRPNGINGSFNKMFDMILE